MRDSNSIKECAPQSVLTGLPTCKDCTPASEALEFGVDDRHFCDGTSCFNREVCSHYEPRLLHVEGLRFPDVTTWVQLPSLEPVIVSHDFDMQPPIDPVSFGSAVAVPYWNIPGLLSFGLNRTTVFRQRNNLKSDQLLVLHGEGQDANLEKLFIRSCDPRFFKTCATLSPVLLVAPGYSVYTDGTQCRHWQTYNLKRSAKFFGDALSFGLPCVPWIASNHDRDTERICEWMNHPNHHFTHVAVNFQTKGQSVLRENVRFASSIESATTKQLHWLVFGVAAESSMQMLASNLHGQLTFVTAKPIQRGRSGRSILGDRKIIGVDRRQIIRDNIRSQQVRAERALLIRGSDNVRNMS